MNIPKGWPTEEMQLAGAQAIRIETTPINKIWTANKVLKAMLQAAPTPPAPAEPVYLTRGPGHASYLHIDEFSVGYYKKIGWAVWVAFPVDLETAKAAEIADTHPDNDGLRKAAEALLDVTSNMIVAEKVFNARITLRAELDKGKP